MTPPRPVIAHVLHWLKLAGAEVLAAELGRKLRDRYEFVYLCLDDLGPLGDQLSAEGFRVVHLQRKPGVDLAVARRISSLCRQWKIDLLHAHQYTPFFYSAASRLPPVNWGMGGPPILFTEHGRHYPDGRKLKRVMFNKLLLRKHDRVTAVGEFVKEALVNNEGIAGCRIEVIRNGIAVSAADPDAAAIRASVRSELGVTGDQVVVMQVARFHSVKDHETSIRAFAKAVELNSRRQSRSPWPLMVYVGDGELRGTIEALARELGVAGSVRFLGVRKDVNDLLLGADLYVLSSLSEGISVTLLEAMNRGLAICCTGVGGNGEVVEHGVTGLLSPRRDVEGLAKNLTRLIADADARRRMGAAGHDRLLALYTQKQMHDGFVAMYDRMLRPA